MTKRYSVFYLILFMVISSTFFQNCGGSFKIQQLQEASLAGSNAAPIDVPIDPLAPLSVYAQNLSVKEGNDFVFTIKLNKTHTDPITVNLVTEAGAVVDPDFFSWTGSVVIAAGQTEAQVRMGTIVQRVNTQDRQFKLKIVSTSAALIAQPTGLVTVRAVVQVLTGFESLFNTYNQLCSISSTGVLKCVGCSPSALATGSPNCAYDKNFRVVSGIPSVRSVTRSCVLTSDDRVLCRGYNYNGEAAVDPAVTTFVEQYTEVAGLGAPVETLYDGWNSHCVLLKTGPVKCWGAGNSGELGNGLKTNSFTPVQVIGLTGVKFLSTGSISRQFCAYQNDGKILCWGNLPNNDGQALVPELLIQQLGVRQISGGFAGLFCLLMESGKVMCIKDKIAGVTNFEERTELTSTAKLIGGFNSLCALGTDRNVKCWGVNMFGKLGFLLKHAETVTLPVPIPKWQGAVDLVASLYNTCALMPDTSVLCSGDYVNGMSGYVFDYPAQTVPAVENVVSAVSYGYGGTCGVTSAGESKCWAPLYKYMDFSLPGPFFKKVNEDFVIVPGAAPTSSLEQLVISINLGETGQSSSGCFITNTGTINCWGTNASGELGNNSTVDSAVPVQVSGLLSVTKIKQYGRTRCALTQLKKLYCWGYNSGQTISKSLPGVFSSVPIEITLVTDVVDFDINYNSMNAVLGNGSVKTWGEEAPAGTIVYSEHVLALTGVKNYNYRTGCATHSNNTVSCSKEYFADGTIRFEVVPGVTNVFPMGSNSVCSVTLARTVKCWGDNQYGQLGTADRLVYLNPVDVKGVANATAVFSTNGLSCAAVNNPVSGLSNILCWGDNWDNRNPSLGVFEMESLRGAKPIIDKEGRAESFIDASGRIRTTATIRLSAGPLPFIAPR